MRPNENVLNRDRIPENLFFQSLQGYFYELFNEIPKFDSSRQSISNDNFIYNTTDDEKIFFENYYLVFTPIKGNFPDGLYDKLKQARQDYILQGCPDSEIGIYESDIIDSVNYPENVIVVLANVGWGKSTLLRYTFFHLIPKYIKNEIDIIPLYFDFNNDDYTFEDDLSKDVQLKDNIHKLFEDTLSKICEEYTTIDNEEFWDFLKNEVPFSKLSGMEKDYKIIYKKDPELFKEEVYKLRLSLKGSDDSSKKITYSCLKFLQTRKRKKIVIICDNIDVLNIRVCEILLKEFHSLGRQFGIKIFAPMRPETYFEIANKRNRLYESYKDAKTIMISPDIKEYIDAKTLKLKEKIEKESQSIKLENLTLTVKDIVEVIVAINNILLNKQVVNFFEAISYKNLRKMNSYLKTYYSSGYHLENKIVTRFLASKTSLDKEIDYSYNPEWIAYASLITYNHRTFFSPRLHPSEKDVILNIFSNGDYDLNNLFIRIHLCNFFSISEKNKMRYEKIEMNYKKVFGDNNQPHEASEAVMYSLQMLINYGLVKCEEYYKVHKLEDVRGIESFIFDDCGKYYLRDLLYKFEYLSFMKDDINFDDDWLIRSCVETSNRQSRYAELFKVFEYLFKKEIEIIERIEELKTFDLYLKHYCLKEKGITYVFNTLKYVEEMVKYGSFQKEIGKHYVNQYTELLYKISTFNTQIQNGRR